MAKRGITQPHRVDYEWSNGISGCKTFTNAWDAAHFMNERALVAKARELSITMTHTERVDGQRITHEVWTVSDAE